MIFCKLKLSFKHLLLLVFIMTSTMNLFPQSKPVWTLLPSLPDNEGWAGMYTGVSKGVLFCMGGANFPGKRPWEGGKKIYYDNIYMIEKGKKWVKLKDKIPFPLAYGVSVTYHDKIIVIGGHSEKKVSGKVIAYEWNGRQLTEMNYPDLPIPLTYMAGALLNNLIIITGGNTILGGPALNKCYGLDLSDIQKGWFELPSWSGRERILPVCAAYNDKFYLFSGETVGINAVNQKYRYILEDAYCFTPNKLNGKWGGEWKTLAPMPRGVCAGGSPLPVLKNGSMVFWGGVDAVAALNKKSNITGPGISKDILLYYPDTDLWEYAGKEEDIAPRVTLPVVYWNNQWVYISGEVEAGIRTNTVIGIQ